jgi:hypothetical protein
MIDDLLFHHIPPDELKGFKKAKRAKNKGGRKRWYDPEEKEYFKWDSQHGKVERYDKRGRHKGEFDPNTGEQTKPADPGRKITPTKIKPMNMSPVTTDHAYLLSWFHKAPSQPRDALRIDFERLTAITDAQIERWFGGNAIDGNEPVYCFDVTEKQVAELQQRVKHRIDLTLYDYSIDCYDPR